MRNFISVSSARKYSYDFFASDIIIQCGNIVKKQETLNFYSRVIEAISAYPRGLQNLHTDTDDYLTFVFARYILIKSEETERNVISGS